jgi:hypothetical protein
MHPELPRLLGRQRAVEQAQVADRRQLLAERADILAGYRDVVRLGRDLSAIAADTRAPLQPSRRRVGHDAPLVVLITQLQRATCLGFSIRVERVERTGLPVAGSPNLTGVAVRVRARCELSSHTAGGVELLGGPGPGNAIVELRGGSSGNARRVQAGRPIELTLTGRRYGPTEQVRIVVTLPFVRARAYNLHPALEFVCEGSTRRTAWATVPRRPPRRGPVHP